MNNLTQNLILAECAVKYVEAVMSRGLGPYNRSESVVHRVLGDYPRPESPTSGPAPAPAQTGAVAFVSRLFYDSPWVADQKAKAKKQDEWRTNLPTRTKEKAQEIREKREAKESVLREILNQPGSDAASKAILCGAAVERSKLGNCGEQSYVAFKYLVTKRAPGLAIVDWGALVGWKEPGKAPTGNHTFVVIGMDASVPATSEASIMIPPVWGDAAVICDPWYHEFFRVESVLDWHGRMKRILGEAKGISPDEPWLNRDAAREQHQTKEYAKSVMNKWKFERLVYLPHVTPTLAHLASVSGEKIPMLHDMRAQHFRGIPT